MWEYEYKALNRGYRQIAGIDEAGRGPLAGPVVSAAVILPHNFSCQGLTDSKKLSEKKRMELFPYIKENAIGVATGVASHMEIDRINILQASLLSMKRSVENLLKTGTSTLPDFLLVDGKFKIAMNIDQSAVVKGDSKSSSIAAASIIAKVTRDALMKELHQKYPRYNFVQHKGYPTKAHKEAIFKYGPCPVHRQTFKGVKEVISGQ